MKSLRIIAPFALIACSLTMHAFADTTADPNAAATAPSDDVATLKAEVETMKAQIAAMQKEILQLKTLIMVWKPANPSNAQASAGASAQNSAVGASIRLMEKTFKGDTSAKLTIVDFSDYQCPFCGRFYRETLPQIEKDYIDTGKARYVLVDHPVSSHVYAPKAAQAAHCAGDQGKFWEMSDSLFADQSSLSADDLVVRAKKLDLDMDLFNRCLDSDKYGPEVTMDLALSQKINIRSVPSFLIGFTDPKSDTLIAEKIIDGAQPYETFKAALDELLKSGPTTHLTPTVPTTRTTTTAPTTQAAEK